MTKKILVFLTLIVVAFLTGCVNNDELETFENKPVTGLSAIFDESLGYYNENPSSFRTGENVQYVYYTRNTEKYNDTTDSIAVRKSTLNDDTVEYGELKTVLTQSEDGWDSSSVSSPDVIKGVFIYQNETYSYLMAYVGSDTENRLNGQIGFAVAKNPDDEFIKVGNSPVISFDKRGESNSGIKNFLGLQEPSLVSYDKEGKVQLFYSFYGRVDASYCVEIDAGNLDNIIIGGKMIVSNENLSDDLENPVLAGADWALDPFSYTYVVVRNYGTDVANLPKVAEGIQVVRAPLEIVNQVHLDEDTQWSLYNYVYSKISGILTSDDYSDDQTRWDGYNRVYNACIVSDEYGWLLDSAKVDFLFTSSATNTSLSLAEDQYLFSQMIHQMDLLNQGN